MDCRARPVESSIGSCTSPTHHNDRGVGGGEEIITEGGDTAFVATHTETTATTTTTMVRKTRDGNGIRSADGYTDSATAAAAVAIGEPDDEDDEDDVEEEDKEECTKRESTISRYARKRIVNYSPSWPICRYGSNSKRVRRQDHLRRGVHAELDKMNGWSKLASISIDGMNGTGKSTLARSMNRTYVKINTHCPDITSGSSYNYSPLRTLDYLMFHVIYDTGDAPVVWDRCRYSNLIFAYVHHLMSVYRDRTMPGPYGDDEPVLFINNMALSTGLFATVSYVESVCADKRPILFIVNSDLCLVAQALLARGGANDVYNAKEYNYQMAQLHVYRYFARLLHAPLIDLNEVFGPLGRTLDYIHDEIRARVDIPVRIDEDLPRPPQRTESKALHTFCDSHNDTMVYQHSTK